MLSSTSSSDRNVSQSWVKTWLFLTLLILMFFATYELLLKQLGYDTSIVSDEDLWSFYRSKAQHNPEALVVLGASRAQLGLHSETIRKFFPKKDVFQLTINGQYPMATLEALAQDESFVGELWVSIVAQSLEPVYWDMQIANNLYFSSQSSWDKRSNAYAHAWLQSHFRFLHPELHGEVLVNQIDKAGAFPKPFYVKEFLDLSKSGDYSGLNRAEMEAHFVAQKEQNYLDQPPMSSATWNEQVKKLKLLVEKIEKRGGQVTFIRMPTDKGHWQLDEQFYPKKDFWDVLLKSTGVRSIHFADFKQLSSFDLPDSSHLDAKDAPVFTTALMELIQAL